MISCGNWYFSLHGAVLREGGMVDFSPVLASKKKDVADSNFVTGDENKKNTVEEQDFISLESVETKRAV